MLSNLYSSRIQEFANDGRILNSGKIYSYILGTTIPKTTYVDINGETPNQNPIILDSNGSASIYLNGSYTLVLTDSNDVLIDTLDIAGSGFDTITSGGSGTFADNIVLSVNTYSDVRALSNQYAWIFVQGREFASDGGQGLFYLDQSSSELDDDGITLTPSTTGRYVRYNVTDISPLWFGGTYNESIEQGTFLDKAEIAAIRYSAPVKINGSTYINQNHSVLSGVEYIFTDDAKLVSTLGVTFTFVEGSKLLECGRRVFGNSVQVKFETGSVEIIKYSIFDADNNEGRVAKLLNSSTSDFPIKFDESFSTSVAPQIPSNFELLYSGSVVTITENTPLSFKTNYTGVGQLFSYSSVLAVGNVSVSGSTSRPEWFGSDNNIAFNACGNTGKIKLSDKEYIVTATFQDTDLIIVGEPEISISQTAKLILSATSPTEFISNTNTFLKNVTLLMTSGSSIDTVLFAADSSYISAATSGSISTQFVNIDSSTISNRNIFVNVPESDIYFSNVQDLSDEYKRYYEGFSAFKDVYLLNEISEFEQFTNFLSTDENGKVYSTQTPNMDALSATHITVDRLDVRFLYTTLIEFRWRNVLGTAYCEVYRNGVLLYDLPGPLTATYDATSADEATIAVNITGDAIGMSRVNLTSANNGISSRFHDINILAMTGNNFQIGGDIAGTVMLFPNALTPGKNAAKCFYYYTIKRWFIS